METVPNQKVVKIRREKEGKRYTVLNIESMCQAARALKAGAFKLWCYMSMNTNGHIFALSPTDCEERFGIGIKQYRGAVEELVEKGYLELERGSVYVFNEKTRREFLTP